MRLVGQWVFLVAIVFPVVLAAQLKFTATHYTSGDSSTASTVTGDFNGDGILDLVSVNQTSLSFFKGLGGGKFAAAVNQALPQNLGHVVAADFNGDGKLDLAIDSGSSGLSLVKILLGNGNGTFKQGVDITLPGPSISVTLADFNGDHVPDLAASFCSKSSCKTYVFLGQGKGLFRLSAQLPYGGGTVVAGDFNADGHQDIAVLASNELVMFLGNGNGSFQSPLLSRQNDPVGLAVGDFYNNRIHSLAVLLAAFDGTNFTYYVSTARYVSGQIQASSPQLVSTSQFYHDIAAGDLNGDFQDDVVVAGGEKFGNGALYSYMLGNGNGTFQSPVNLAAYGEAEELPFIRDLNFDSRHDIGAAWTNGYIVTGGGPYVSLNSNAPTNCTPPNAASLSVHVCAPSNGQVVGASFTFRAAGNAFNGIAKRMELWIDGKKVGQNLEDQFKQTVNLSSGKHVASFIAVDSFDNHTTQSVTFTAQ